jgi:hypothetical protein
MKRVFISHPYIDDPVLRKTQISEICDGITATHKDIILLSPIHMFSFIKSDDEDRYREAIMEICFELIALADEIWIYHYDPTAPLKLSEGQIRELYEAIHKEKPIIFKEG